MQEINEILSAATTKNLQVKLDIYPNIETDFRIVEPGNTESVAYVTYNQQSNTTYFTVFVNGNAKGVDKQGCIDYILNY